MAKRGLNFATLILLGFVGTFQASACPAATRSGVQQPAKPTAVQVQELAAQPAKYLKQTVLTSGTLENQGKNYFTDLRLILKDDQGRFVHVRPWLPVSLPPTPPGRSGANEKRPVLSDFLGKKVELTAVVQKGDLRRAGDVYYLEVSSARIL